MMPWAHASPQPKRHLDRFSRVCTDDRGVSLYFTMVCLFPLKIAPSHVGIWTSCNTWFIGPTGVLNSNGNLIVSAVSARLTIVTDWQSDRQTDRQTALFRKNSPPPRSTSCVQICWNLADGKSVKSCVRYITKKNKTSPRSLALASAQIAPKIYQGQRQTMYCECPKCHPNRFTSGEFVAERVNTVKTHHKVNPILGLSYIASRRVITCWKWIPVPPIPVSSLTK